MTAPILESVHLVAAEDLMPVQACHNHQFIFTHNLLLLLLLLLLFLLFFAFLLYKAVNVGMVGMENVTSRRNTHMTTCILCNAF